MVKANDRSALILIKGTSILREQNKRKVLSFVRQLGETSRQDLVKKMNVSKNTISLIVDEFINEGILVELGVKEPGKKGRPKVLIKLNEDGYKSIGISVSKTRMEYSIINYYGQVIEKKTFSNEGIDPVQTKEQLLKLIRSLLQTKTNIIGIGIGIPGIVNSEKKFIYLSTHLNWKNISLDELEEFSIPIYVQNSVNMGAIGALHLEGDTGEGNTFYVRVSEGVGGAYIINNVSLDGDSWTAGEIGHISIDSAGDRCECGQRGCLELLINYKAFIEKLESFGHSPIMKDGEIQFEREVIQSKDVQQLMHKYGIYLGKALVQVVHLMNPNKLIIDAPYNLFEQFQQGCLTYLKAHALTIPLQHTHIIFGTQRYNMSHGAALTSIINYEKSY